MSPDAYNLQSVVVKTRRGRNAAYKKKGNPAVELVNKVIAHKDQNRVKNAEHYSVDTYENLILALDKFEVNFDSSRFWCNSSSLKSTWIPPSSSPPRNSPSRSRKPRRRTSTSRNPAGSTAW